MECSQLHILIFVHLALHFLLIPLLKLVNCEEKNVQLAMVLESLMAFQNLKGVNQYSKWRPPLAY